MKKPNLQEIKDIDLRTAMRKAWAGFDSPESQQAMQEQSEADVAREKDLARGRVHRGMLKTGAPLEACELIADGKVENRYAVEQAQIASHTLLVLAGNTGSGKTLAACSRLSGESSGLFVRAAELCELGRHFTDRARLDQIRLCSFLVIDDLGTEYQDDRMLSRLDVLTDARTAHRRPTIITTNMPMDEFRQKYKDRIWSRMSQFGDFQWIDDEDIRIAKRGVRNG